MIINKSFVGGAMLLFAHFTMAQQYAFVKKWDFRYGGNLIDGPTTGPIPTKDHGFLLAGNSTSNASGNKIEQGKGGFDFWIVKIDSLGNKIWDRVLGGVADESLSSVLQLDDGTFVIAGTMGLGANGDISQSSRGGIDYWVIKVDSNGNKLWDKRFGGVGSDLLTSISKTKENGYILNGISNSPAGADKTQSNWDTFNFHEDVWIVKIDSVGNKLWDKRYGGIGEDQGLAILQTDDGGYLLGCYSASDSSGDKTQRWWGYQIPAYWIIKIDSVGNKQWDKRYGGLGGEQFSFFIKTFDEGYILAGSSTSNIGGDKTQNNWGYNRDFWIVKIDSSGNKLWDKDFGSLDDDQLDRVAPTKDHGFLLSGWSSSNLGGGGDKTELNLGGFQSWIVKIDSVGNKQWDKTILTTGGDSNGYAIETADGCYLITTASNGGIGGNKTQAAWDSSYDFFVVKFCMEPFTGINEQAAVGCTQLQVYPNPFVTDISISIQKQNLHAATFTITDAVGQTIYQRQETNLSSNYTKMLDLSYLPKGVYFIAVEVDGERTVKQVVKQ